MALIWYNIVFVYFYNDLEKNPQRLCVRENLYNFTMTTNSLSEQIINRTPQLNNRAENQTVKKPHKFLGGFFGGP